MAREHLATYLNDHLAGSMAALEHLRDLEQAAPAMAPALAELRCDIESDRKALESLIHRLGLTESRARQAGAWLAEKAARLKMRVDDRAGGPLRRLEGLEAVALGIDGKLALWRALGAAAEAAPDLRAVDYQHLAERARDQRERVEALRLEAAREALA